MRATLQYLLARRGTVLEWRMFRGYGFVQDTASGEQFFAHRSNLHGALFLPLGKPVLFEIGEGAMLDVANPGEAHKLRRCVSVLDANGKPFEMQAKEGVVLDLPVPSLDKLGVIQCVDSLTASSEMTAVDSLFHFSFSHSKRLRIGDPVRFWSSRNALQRSAKDVIAVDLTTLSGERKKIYDIIKVAAISRQVSPTADAIGNFLKQQRQVLPNERDSPANFSLTGKLIRSAAVTSHDSFSELVDCRVEHVHGRYGKLSIRHNELSSIVFFHVDMVVGVPNQIRSGMRGKCTYELVRMGKHSGTLRAVKVYLSPQL